MTVNIFKSTDTNAPVMNSVAGTLITLLDACLVNGYSLGTVSSITRSGSTATLTFSSAHGMAVNSSANRVTIAGANETEYNGNYLVSVPTTTTLTYTVSGTPASPATGSITCVKPGAGWAKTFSGTNTAVYTPSGGNQRPLRIDDTGTTSARARGYESMSDVDTGVGPFPTDAQLSGGGYWYKGNASGRPWVIIANDTWIVYRTATSANTSYSISFYGDFLSNLNVTDSYNTLLACPSSGPYSSSVFTTQTSSIATAVPGHYIPRSYLQTGGSITAGKSWNYTIGKTVPMGQDGVPYPDPITGNLLFSPVSIYENATTTIRGLLNMILVPLHNTPLTDLDSFDGTGDYLGNSYIVLNSNTSIFGQFFVQYAGAGV